MCSSDLFCDCGERIYFRDDGKPEHQFAGEAICETCAHLDKVRENGERVTYALKRYRVYVATHSFERGGPDATHYRPTISPLCEAYAVCCEGRTKSHRSH